MVRSGCILAGGRNSRMDGYPKGNLTIEGERFLDRIHRRLGQVTETIYVSVHDDIPVELPKTTKVIRDQPSTLRCSLNGVYSTLYFLQEPVIIVPWDMPFVTVCHLSRLKKFHRTEANETNIVYEVDGQLQPFPGLYTPSLLPYLRTALNENNVALRRVLKKNSTEIEPPEKLPDKDTNPPLAFENVNTPQKYEDLV